MNNLQADDDERLAVSAPLATLLGVICLSLMQ